MENNEIVVRIKHEIEPFVHEGRKKRDMEDFHHIISDTSYSVYQVYLI